MSRARTGWSLRRVVAAAVGGVLLAPALVWTGASSASAAPVTGTIDDITYAADDAAPGAGAQATGYSGPGGPVVIPDTVTLDGVEYDVVAIAASAFSDDGITSVSLGANVRTVGAAAFQDNEITHVSLPAGLERIDDWGFAYNQIASLDLPAGVSLGLLAFAGNALTSLDLPVGFDFPSAEAEGTAQFSDNRIESVTIPDSVTTLPHYVFEQNLLTHVEIPASVTEIREDAFAGNPLATITFLGDAPTVTDTGGGWNPGAELRYSCGFDVVNGGGFTSPVWNDGSTDHAASALPVTVTFDIVHGEPIVESVGCMESVVAPAAPVAEGYEFVGWTFHGDPIDPDGLTVATDVTFVAQWEPAEDTEVPGDPDVTDPADEDTSDTGDQADAADPADGSGDSTDTASGDGATSSSGSTGAASLPETGLSPLAGLAAGLGLVLVLLGGTALVAARRT